MSADEFDPMIERLFARSPQMADASLFAAEVETKLHSSSRVRTLALTAAGLIGGVIAVRESMNLNLHLSNDQAARGRSRHRPRLPGGERERPGRGAAPACRNWACRISAWGRWAGCSCSGSPPGP